MPIWLKLVTVAGIYPAWLFILYFAFTGAYKSEEALIALGVCKMGTLLHIAFDRRAQGRGQEASGSDISGGE